MALTSPSFFPALGRKTSVLVPVNNGGVVHLRFTVTVDPEEYRELERQNAQLQLWSDIPALGAGRPAGQWGEISFQREEGVPTGTVEGSEGVVRFNAKSSGTSTAGETSNNKTLSGASTLDVAGTWQYSFTYRLASSSGEVTWLGGYGQDGVLVLSSNPRLAAQSDGTLLQVSGSWSALDGTDDSASSRTFARDIGTGEQHNDLEVLRLGKASTYSLLGISKNGSLNSARNIEDAAILLAIPHPAPEILVTPTLLLAASTDAHLSMISADNIVSASGSGTIRLAFIDTHCPNASINQAIQDAIAWGSSSARILSPESDRVTSLILASGESTTPAQVATIPRSGVPEDVAIPVQTLTSLLPKDTQQFAIVSVEARTAGIYSAASGGIHTVVVSTGPEGAELVLSPSYDLLGPAETPHDPSLLVSFLTAHSLAFSAPSEDGADVLPTPPPSPPHRAVNTSDPVDPLTPSTSGSTQFSDLTTSISNSSDVSCTTASSGSTIPRSNSSSNSERALIPQLGMRRNRGMVIACMGLFVHMAKVFIGSIFCRVFYLLFGSGAGARAGKTQKMGNGRSKLTEKADERTALLPKETGTPSPVTLRMEKEKPVVSEPPAVEEHIVGNTSTKTVSTARSRFEYTFDLPAGKATLLIQDKSLALQLWKDVSILVDGKTAVPNVEATLDDSASAGDLKIMTFELERSARVKVYMNC
ncbi:hypothetical protein PC9H_003945 [Pleurotus ostreatus]|uniref:Uncharacterized protein n=1 Tax=Pleurotus ostreatus TaxID=5322 RepID=A0A8H7A3A6_PLEOS|nr:uncharacterized protein PC9H_003945 [Pleurotus ostreatus]KAF7437111.1 hypothetical protein PC9H_003945 [Pleurotus ostreatus]